MRSVITGLIVALSLSPAVAQTPSTAAFDQAYAASFYTFDACGDGVAGRIYRNVLQDRFAQCPFPDAARASFRERSALQRRKSSQMIGATIARNDGVPVKLDGMDMSCREQRTSERYRAFRAKLEQFAAGGAAATEVVPEACGATTFSPY